MQWPALPLPPWAPGDLHGDAGDPEAHFWPRLAWQLEQPPPPKSLVPGTGQPHVLQSVTCFLPWNPLCPVQMLLNKVGSSAFHITEGEECLLLLTDSLHSWGPVKWDYCEAWDNNKHADIFVSSSHWTCSGNWEILEEVKRQRLLILSTCEKLSAFTLRIAHLENIGFFNVSFWDWSYCHNTTDGYIKIHASSKCHNYEY